MSEEAHPHLEARLRALSAAHQKGIRRFLGRLPAFVGRGLLNAAQVEVLEDFLLSLGEANRNPSNTGNLEDLFCYTLADTKDPVRAFAQAMADAIKVVPMDDAAELRPRLKVMGNGRVFSKVGDLTGYNAADKMLITHTMVAYGDPAMRRTAARFIRASREVDDAALEREIARMAVQSQHGPSSTFVLARTRGLTIDVAALYRDGGYSDATIEDAQRFYDVCARFDPKWVLPFLDGFIPSSDEWSAWRRQYLEARARLPSELIYQLSSDTLTNFLDGTLESGKWTDASIVFGGVKSAEEIPSALAKIVNQYVAEHIALHDRPAEELLGAVAPPLEPWGVGFVDGRAVALDGRAKNANEIQAQFDAAWARMHKPRS